LHRSTVAQLAFVLACSTIAYAVVSGLPLEQRAPRFARPSPLPLPPLPVTSDGAGGRGGGLTPLGFEQRLYDFLVERRYDHELGWAVDKGVRDTGPFIDGVYYGTHPAVRIYYSPEVIAWLDGGREGTLPDGATIVKEMFRPPAARHAGLDGEALAAAISGWTVMIRRRDASADGWYWSGATPGQRPEATTAFPAESGYGLSCLRCHASAERESTFATTANVAGYPGEPLRFRVDDSWRDLPPEVKPWNSPHSFADEVAPVHAHAPRAASDPAFLAFYDSIGPVARSGVQAFPPQVFDTVVAGPDGADAFVSSDQCMMCHGGLSAAPGPEMFLQTGPTNPDTFVTPGFNVSPYGEWRRSPMGLAGRDPIFHAQLESELAILAEEHASDPAQARELSEAVVDTCLSCHGAMGQRQHALDTGGEPFDRDWIFRTEGEPSHVRYGALARDGISCTVCHRSVAGGGAYAGADTLRDFLETSITGQLTLAEPGEVVGPFEDVVTLPMENALGIEPRADGFVRSARTCGTCHAINLPNVDDPLRPGHATTLDRIEKNPVFRPYRHSIEQATYLEWLNSEYENEVNPNNPRARTCQDCHMPRGFDAPEAGVRLDAIGTRIAAIQDDTYPAAEHEAPAEELHVRLREEGYARHELLGLNAFLLEMFAQFPDLLGVGLGDYMTGSVTDLQHAMDNLVRQARERTATVALDAIEVRDGEVVVDVEVTNLTGHRLPSGVGFRRLFLEVALLAEGSADPLWASGRANALGVLVDGEGRPLATELFAPDRAGRPLYQPHHERIDSEDRVQIYEELNLDGEGRVTTSFVHRDEELKDNRLLPRGWRPKGPDPELYPQIADFIEATHPKGRATADERYADGSGSDVVRYAIPLPGGVDVDDLRVRAALWSQSIPPYYLKQRFETSQGPAARRLHYLASHLDLAGTPIEGWKLFVASDERRLVGD